jgi:hypothetical protein
LLASHKWSLGDQTELTAASGELDFELPPLPPA